MAAYALDTSAVLKRYVRERGASWIARVTDPRAGNELYIARIVGPERVATLARLARNGAITSTDRQAYRRLFEEECATLYRIVELTAGMATLAMDLAERQGLRGSDAIHLAAALEVQRERRAAGQSPLTFVSADERQLAAARAEELAVQNPERRRP